MAHGLVNTSIQNPEAPLDPSCLGVSTVCFQNILLHILLDSEARGWLTWDWCVVLG